MSVEPSAARDHVIFESAAEHATARVPIVRPVQRAGDVRRELTGREYDSASHLVVLDDERFAGIVTIELLLAAHDDATMDSLMDRDAPRVGPGVDQEVAAWHALRHHEAALSVVDERGRWLGLIPPDRLLAVLLAEHEEDLSRLGGFLKGASRARESSEETVRRRFWHRLPWLLAGLGGALAAADLVGHFEGQLAANVMIAFFVPSIVYLADAVGTQTETIVVRGLSVGASLDRMVGRELFAGLVIGSALAALAGPFVWWRWGDGALAFAVGLSLLAACSTATVFAMALPWIFVRAGLDPAFGSGPLATVLQDLLSILIYFLVVGAVTS